MGNEETVKFLESPWMAKNKSRYNRELFSTTAFDVTQEFHVK